MKPQCPELTLWRQWIAGAAAMMMMFVMGLSIGWSSPYLAQFTSGESPFPATADEISWIASISQLGRIPGAILGSICIQYFGSKTAMVSTGFGLVISWILVILANSVGWLFVSRFIVGASSDGGSTSYPLYLADISCSKIRGALVILAGNGLVIGILTGSAMGNYLSMKIFACVSLVPTIGSLLIFLWIPHSPYYLTSKGKIKEAEKSVLRYNPKANVKLEMESIQKYIAISNSSTITDRLREFNIPRNRKAGLIVVTLTLFDQFSGANPLTAYMESIMTRGMLTIIAPSTVPIIANGVGIITGWASMYIAEKCGRRIMWASSSAGVCGSLTAMGTHFYLISNGFDPARLQWLPIFSIVLFKFSYNTGIASVPVILFSELFASNIRALAGCIIAVFSAISGFIAMYGYQFLIDNLHEAYVWWIHAICMAVSLIFGLLLVPETRGKTLLEIQDSMMKS